jgi:hypothetical protein
MGRATSDAELGKVDDEGRVSKAVFTLALNIPIRRGNQTTSRTLYRRVMALGSFANYVAGCQTDGGLKGRLINVIGVMDDEHCTDEDGEEYFQDIVRTAPGAGFIKIMDRRARNDG